jgi:23S rRNA (cytosine1962-C5)-methyltransferase
VDEYAFIDAGGGARLERFGDRLVVRPHPGATEGRRAPERWAEPDLRYDRDAGWSGSGLDAARGGWIAEIAGLALELKPTDAGQVGVFPEHAARCPGSTNASPSGPGRRSPS